MSLTSILIAAGVAILLIVIARRRDDAPDAPGVRAETATEADLPALVSAGRKIEAIKVYRRLHGVDLKAAKDAIDQLEANLPGAGGS